MFDNLLQLYPLGDLAQRLLTEYEFPAPLMNKLVPMVEIAPEGETVVKIPDAEMNVEGVRPYRGGADLEFELMAGTSMSLTTQLYDSAHLILPSMVEAWQRRKLTTDQIEALIAATARAKFIAKREAAVAAFLDSDTPWGANVDTSAHKWTTDDGDPLADLKQMVAAMRIPPNVCGMSQAAYAAMLTNPNFADYFKGFTIGTPDVVKSLLAAYLGIAGLELVIDEGRGYVPRWYSGTVTLSKYLDTDVMMVSYSAGIENAFLTNGDPVHAFAVSPYTKGSQYPDEGFVQLPQKGKAAAYVIYDYFKPTVVSAKMGYKMKDVI